MYFYSRIRNRKALFVYSLLLVIILLFSYNEIFNFVDILFKNEKTSASGMVYALNRVSIQRILVAWSVVIFQYLSNKSKNVDMQNQVFFNISLLNAVILTSTMNSAYLARLTIYTSSIPIISIPLVLVKYDKYLRLILAIVINILFFIYWYYEATGQFLVIYQWVL